MEPVHEEAASPANAHSTEIRAGSTNHHANAGPRILIVRLGAMGDVIHTLPAAATIRHSFPGCHLSWVLHPRWAPLLEGNPYVDRVIRFDRRSLPGIPATWRALEAGHFDLAVDFQGLIQSALVATAARAEHVYGFHESQVKERLAALFYSRRVRTAAVHVVDRNLELAQAAGATSIVRTFPLPEGCTEGSLPQGGFVLASPAAGWKAKQWPVSYYSHLAKLLLERLGLPLVVNGAPGDPMLDEIEGAIPHASSLAGLIGATRRATAVVGVDSGPLHLAAALQKPGVAIFGPTSPERNGPYGDSFVTLRSPHAPTTYKRRPVIDESMWQVSPEAVFDALAARIQAPQSAGCSA